ncbi:putative RNA methyltransferase [Nocardia sp. NBC_01329]|uniref:putative RNA methyltransferase n=1 Tax=Nocardia sp. NBC_01329 TaxID=2903594 RepID=UPI002E164D39|nr:methyltransferase type 11 [Nocardia sp. NBC_01329]
MSPARQVAEKSALAAVAEVLSCPECDRGLSPVEGALRCAHGHSFDIARQGYISLLTGAATKMTGDSAAMLDARATFQGAGYFTPIADAIAAATVTGHDPGAHGILADIGAGTGYYLARVLDAFPAARGIGLDIAKPAGRRCARAHPRAAAVVADAWRGLPIRDQTLTAALSVFAPRNPEAVSRVLAPGGRYIVVTPTTTHLAELIEPIGMVTVDPEKDRRLAEAMAGRFTRTEHRTIEYVMTLPRADIANLVAMGPSAHHADAAAERIARLPETFEVTASVTVGTYLPN